MSKIQFEQIDEDVVEIVIPPETPMQMVEQLTKSLISKGLVEDVSNSTLSLRYFYRPADKANELANKLIKSLEGLSKDSASAKELPHWHPKAQMAHQKQLREKAISERRAKLGMGTPAPQAPNISNKPTPNASPSGVGHIPHDSPNTAGGTGRRYAYIKDPVTKMEKKEEHPESCTCGKCESVEKSGYGPKGAGLYNPADNARRKANNTGDVAGLGPNVNAKAYSSKPGQLSGKEQASITARIQSAANRKAPVTHWSPERIAEENAKRGLKKSWGQHLPFPSAEEEIMKLAGMNQTDTGENAMANQLANMMQSKSMLSNHQQPSRDEFLAAGEAMGLGTTEEMVKKADEQWNGALNNWLAEATKPISQRFNSEEEELAYWNSIKVNGGGDDGKPGY